MAGFSSALWFGEPGGFMGADGMNPIESEVLIGNADRQWLEVATWVPAQLRMGNLTHFVPVEPDSPTNVLDAALAFFTHRFTGLPSYAVVLRQLGERVFLDFDLKPREIPSAWNRLRDEARPIFTNLYIMRGEFTREITSVSR